MITVLNISVSQLDIAARAFGWTVALPADLGRKDALLHVFRRGTEQATLWVEAGIIEEFGYSNTANGNFAAVAGEVAKVEALIQLSQLEA